jgi:hypothetical protein
VHDFTFLPVHGLACIRVRSDELMAFCNLALMAYRVFDPRLGTGLSMTSYNAPCLHYPVAKQIILLMDGWLFTSPSRARGKELSWLHASRAFVPFRLHGYRFAHAHELWSQRRGVDGVGGRGAMVVGQRPGIVRKLWFLFLVCGH